jgi:hypothetical protein
MALAQVGLGTVIQVAAGTTATVYTVGSAKTAYVRSVLLHNRSTSSTANVALHVVPNSSGSVGAATSINQIALVGISTSDTYFFECAYPITLGSTNDTIIVYNGNTSDAINVLVLGDREA